MYTKSLLSTFAVLAVANAQVPPPASLLTSTQSGVLPIAPTPFPGLPTEEGALINDGPPLLGFTGPGGNATIQSNMPKATYIATLPPTNFDPLTGSIITGSVTAARAENGTGVTFFVNFTGFPSEAAYGPFVYHVHTLPVPADGNCTATMGHLDPTDRGEYHPCEVAAIQTCQAGDLAGKHGNITGTTFTIAYNEPYLSTDPSSPYFFGDKSIVIHTSNTTRLTCANFMMVGASSTTNSTQPSITPPPPSQAGAGRISGTVVGTIFGGVVAAVAVLFL